MILAPVWLAPAERADGEHLILLRAEGVATDADERRFFDDHGLEHGLRILSTLTGERLTLARGLHPAGVEFVGHEVAPSRGGALSDDRTGAGELTTRTDRRTTLPPPVVVRRPVETRTARTFPGSARSTVVSAWRERWQIAAACAIAVILILQLARGGWQ